MPQLPVSPRRPSLSPTSSERTFTEAPSLRTPASQASSCRQIPQLPCLWPPPATRAHPPAPPSPDEIKRQKKAAAAAAAKASADEAKDGSWGALPHKSQLAIITLARLAEPLCQKSLQAYLYHQLSSFSPDATPAMIATQAGVVQAAFSLAQAVTAIFWGTVADSPRFGRKTVIMLGLCGTAIGSLGYGFSRTFSTAIMWRVVAGILNGNTAVVRTMVSEIVHDKKHLRRAFLLLPMCFNVGVIIGPILGGVLAEPAKTFPNAFGPGSTLGGADGVWWMQRWPYALPNIVSAACLFASALLVLFGLKETHELLRNNDDFGLRTRKAITLGVCRLFSRDPYAYRLLGLSRPPQLHDQEEEDLIVDDLNTDETATLLSATSPMAPGPARKRPQSQETEIIVVMKRLPFYRIWTRNVVTTLASHFLLVMGMGTFGSLWFIFLSTPRDTQPPHLPFGFTGGLGLPPSEVGLAMSLLGFMGIALQILVYPSVSGKLGTIRSYNLALALFPFVYFITPYLSVLPSSQPAPAPSSGPLVWTALLALLALYTLGRTFAQPSNVLLVNNCSPHPSVLGTIHGIAQSISGLGRTIGPVVGAMVFGWGERVGHVGAAHWILALVAFVGWAVSLLVHEGDGHSILLEGEVADDGTDDTATLVGEDEDSDEDQRPYADSPGADPRRYEDEPSFGRRSSAFSAHRGNAYTDRRGSAYSDRRGSVDPAGRRHSAFDTELGQVRVMSYVRRGSAFVQGDEHGHRDCARLRDSMG